MSTLGDIPIEIANWQGWREPQYPNGVWFSRLSLLGDASGGNTEVSHVFKEAGQPAPNEFYSLERVNVQLSLGTAMAGGYIGVGLNRTFGNSFRSVGSALAGPAAANSSFSMDAVGNFHGALLGECTRVNASDSRLIVQVANPGAGEFLDSSIAGYFWGPEARAVAGGPQRPPGGMFRI